MAPKTITVNGKQYLLVGPKWSPQIKPNPMRIYPALSTLGAASKGG